MDRLLHECYDKALGEFRQKASTVTGGSVVEYAKGTWKAVLSTDLAEVAFATFLTKLTKTASGGFGMGSVVAGTYRAIRRHLVAARQLLEAQSRYEAAKDGCNRQMGFFRSQADREYALRQ